MKTNFLKFSLMIVLGLLTYSISCWSQSSMFLGTPDHLGLYQSDFPEKVILKKSWSLKTGGKIFGTASISEGVVFFGSDDSCLYAVETGGNLKWKVRLNGKIRSTPAIKDTLLFIHDYSGQIYALNCKDGSHVWKYETEGEFGLPDFYFNKEKDINKVDPWDVYLASAIYNDTAVYFAIGKNLYALNQKSGTLYWSYTAANIMHSSPALSSGKLYVGCWDSKIYAINATNGEKIWDFQTGNTPEGMSGIPSSPTVIDSFVFIGSRDANVYALNSNTGKQIWKTSFGGSWMPSSFVVVNDTVFTGSSDATKLFALDKKSGTINYSVKLPSYVFSTPAYSKGTMFIGCANGSLFCIKDKKIIARFDTDGHKQNYFKALNQDGTLNMSAFPNPTNYEENLKWCEILFSTGSIFATPVIAENKVFFGSTDSSFYAIEDDGSVKPDFNVSTQNLNFNASTGTVVINSVIEVTNTGESVDSFAVSLSGTHSKLTKGAVFEPAILKLNPGEKGIINMSGSIDFPKAINLKTSFGIFCVRNEYILYKVNVEFNIATLAKKVEKTEVFNLYPNPVKDLIKFQVYAGFKKAELIILNNMNQVIKILPVEGETGTIDLSGLSAGLYYICLKTDDNSSVKSFVKM